MFVYPEFADFKKKYYLKLNLKRGKIMKITCGFSASWTETLELKIIFRDRSKH